MTKGCAPRAPIAEGAFVFGAQADAEVASLATADLGGAKAFALFNCPTSGGLCRIALGRPGRKPGDRADVVCSRPGCRFHTNAGDANA